MNRIAVATLAVVLAVGAASCAAQSRRGTARASAQLGRAVRRGDAQAVRGHVVPGARAGVDTGVWSRDRRRKGTAAALRRPREIHPESTVLITRDLPADLVWTSEGWRFADDPSDAYSQRTPEQAVRALVWATRNERWDVVLRLAPRRYRIGLSEEDLAAAWTEGEQAATLRAARDRIAEHLGDPVPHDDHEAKLDLGGAHAVRLEREGDVWVVVDF